MDKLNIYNSELAPVRRRSDGAIFMFWMLRYRDKFGRHYAQIANSDTNETLPVVGPAQTKWGLKRLIKQEIAKHLGAA